MPTRFLFACLCITGLGVICSGEDKPRDETAIQGTWELIARSKPAEPDIVCERIVFEGEKMTFHYSLNGKRFTTECTFKLDPTTTPKRIDFTKTGDNKNSKPYLGIYEFKNGELRISYRGPQSTRPKDFSDERDGTLVTVGYTFEPKRK
jgi:uncharacterized protein (TIGR03067 family)